MKLSRSSRGHSHIGGLVFLAIVAFAVIWAADRPGQVVVFSGRDRVVTDEFRGAEMTTIFGGNKLDLRQATISGKDAVLNITTIFGGTELLIPPDWTVIDESKTIMGGWEDHTRHPVEAGGPRLIVEGTTIFGGFEIRN